jgi:predicted trehalose synthase
MGDLVTDAADVLVPLLSAGAGVAVRDLVDRAGDQVAETTIGVLAKLRARLKGQTATAANVEAALRKEISSGEVVAAQLEEIVSLRQGAGSIYNQDVRVQGNAIVGSNMRIDGDFHLGA